MKTTSNAPKTRLNHLKKVITRNSAVIACLVLISGPISAQDFWKQFQSDSQSDKVVTSSVELVSETAKTYKYIQTFEAAPMLDIDVLVNNSEYKPVEFVEAESALQIDLLMNNSKYEAKNYVESEMAVEIEPLIKDDNFIQTAETSTASECDQQIERFANSQILLQENRISRQIAEAQTGN